MAVEFVRELGAVAPGGSVGSGGYLVTDAIPAGHTVIGIGLGRGNLRGLGLSDTRGNTYHPDVDTTPNTTPRPDISFCRGYVRTALQPGDRIFGSFVNRLLLTEWAGLPETAARGYSILATGGGPLLPDAAIDQWARFSNNNLPLGTPLQCGPVELTSASLPELLLAGAAVYDSTLPFAPTGGGWTALSPFGVTAGGFPITAQAYYRTAAVSGPWSFGGGAGPVGSVALAAYLPLLAVSGGVDLVQLAGTGALVRSRRQGSNVYVEASFNAGVTWETHLVANNAANDAAPSLAAAPDDTVLLWYHDTAGRARGYRTGNGLSDWVAHATHAGLRFPRMGTRFTGQVLAAHDGDGLTFRRSGDAGATLDPEAFRVDAAPAQLPALRMDRWETLHVVYHAGGTLFHRYDTGTGLSPAVAVASGELPAYALGLTGGLLAWWDAGELKVGWLDDAGGSVQALVSTPAGNFARSYLGALIDPRAERWWLMGLDAANPAVVRARWSEDHGGQWTAPA